MASSDYFPDWDREKCERYKVINTEIVLEYIKKKISPVIIIGEKAFTYSLPYLEPVRKEIRNKIWQAIKENYKLAKIYPNFLIKGTKTYIFIRKE